MPFEELKARQSVMWGNGPYERITQTLADMHQVVIDRVDPQPGDRLLDAATGTGALAILAARRGADVTGLDFAPALIETARARAAEEGVTVAFELGDVEAMPFEDATFDKVTSTVGTMFAPDHGAVARELARVTKPGGRLVLACWTLEGGIGQLFVMMRPYLPPPPEGAGSPFAWGTRDHVTELLGDAFELEFEDHDSVYDWDSGEEYWELFATSYGPPKTALDNLEESRREQFHADWLAFAEKHRQGDRIVHHREYLLTVGTRR